MSDIKQLKKFTSSLNVLYVEDDIELLEKFKSYLSKLFNSVTTATNGEEGLELYKSGDYDLVISDINMPKMNGLTMAGEIKKIDNEQVIILISAYSDSQILMESITLGIDGYIVKPIEFEEINKTLLKLCVYIRNKKEDDINFEQQKFLLNDIKAKNILLKQYMNVIDKVAIISKTDLKGYITEVNQLFCEISGYTKSELIGKNHNIIRHPDVPKSVYKELWETIKKGDVWEGTVKNKCKDGSEYYVHATVIPILDEKHDIVEYIGIRFLSTEDEIEKKEFRKKVRTSFMEYKKINNDLSKKVEKLEKELASKEEMEMMQNATIDDLKSSFTQVKDELAGYKGSSLTEKYTRNLDEINHKLKESNMQLNLKKKELTDLKDDLENKKKEIIRLNDEVIAQHDIIADLRDTIANIDDDNKEEKEHKDEDKKTSIFGKYFG